MFLITCDTIQKVIASMKFKISLLYNIILSVHPLREISPSKYGNFLFYYPEISVELETRNSVIFDRLQRTDHGYFSYILRG